MTQITLDGEAAGKLSQLTGTAELRDPSGRVLVRFVPKMDLSEWEPVTPDIDEAELDRREKSDYWYTFDEVTAHLNSLR